MKTNIKKLITLFSLIIIVVFGSRFIMNNYKFTQLPPEIKAQFEKIETLPLLKFKKNIEQGKWNLIQEKPLPTFIFIYASWCPYCKKQYPAIIELQKEYKGKIKFIFLSSDRSKEKLATLLSQKTQPLPFTPYNISAKSAPSYKAYITSKGGYFNGGVPYMILFDKQGKLKQEIGGLLARNQIEALLNKKINP